MAKDSGATAAIEIVYKVAAIDRPAGGGADCCVFCMGPWTGWSERGSHCDHAEGCAWVAARQFAGRVVP